MFGSFITPAQLLIAAGIVLMLFGVNRSPELLREIGRLVCNCEVGPSVRTVRNIEIVLVVLVALFLVLLVVAAFQPEIIGY